MSSLSAGNQRNSQLRSTFNKAKQHLSFDKWRTAAIGSTTGSASASVAASGQSPATESSSSSSNNMILRRASACTMASGGATGVGPGGGSQREDATTPGESPGGRLSRWFSIRRGSSHQYDVGGRDGRHSTASSFDTPDSGSSGGKGVSLGGGEARGGAGGGGTTEAALDAASTQKLASFGASKMMPGVPEVSINS